MGMWTRIRQWLAEPAGRPWGDVHPPSNPASGPSMTASGIDVMGNPIGVDLRRMAEQPPLAPSYDHDPIRHNPATGLPMSGGTDIMGNPYGTDLTQSAAASSSFVPPPSYDPSRGW